MGLDFSHGNAHWSYSGFHRFREKLAHELGLRLGDMYGFGGNQPWPDPKIEPLVYLLDHSDCEGDLSPAKCRKIAPRLREIAASWDTDSYDTCEAFALADGMDLAHRARQRLRFC